MILPFVAYYMVKKYGLLHQGGMEAKGIWKQNTEANILAQEGWDFRVEKAPQRGTS